VAVGSVGVVITEVETGSESRGVPDGSPETELSRRSDSWSEYFPAFCDCILEQLLPVDSVHKILDKNASKDLLQGGGDLGRVRNDHILILQHFDEFGDGLAFEGTLSKDHLVEHNSQGPDVCLCGVYFSLDDFGGHVDGGAEHGVDHVVLAFEGLAEAEVCDFDAPVVDEDVVGLDIAVHDVGAGEDLEGLEHLSEEIECLFFGEGAFLLHEFIHGATIAELVDEVEVVGGFEHVDVLHDVGTVLQVGEDVDLVNCAFLQLRNLPELLRLHHLYRHLLLRPQMHRLVYLCVHALSQLLLQLVVFDYFPHLQ
jgi:hypothetical protein